MSEIVESFGEKNTILASRVLDNKHGLIMAAEFYDGVEPRQVKLFGSTSTRGGGWTHSILHKVVLRTKLNSRWKKLTVLPSRRDALASVVARFTNLTEAEAQAFVDACPEYIPVQRVSDVSAAISKIVRNFDQSEHGTTERRDLLASMEQTEMLKFRAVLHDALQIAVAVGITEEELLYGWRMAVVSSVHIR